MKKFKLVVVTFIAGLLGMPLAYAECDATETNKLSSLANNVKVSQEIIQKEFELGVGDNPPDGLTEEEIKDYKMKVDYFKIYISNITEEIYVVVTNNNTKQTKTFNYKDTQNGTAFFEEEVGSEIVNYTIEVHASGKTNCNSKKLRTFYLTTPMYNIFSESSLCEGIKEFYLCHEYLSVKTTFDKFEELTNQYRDGKLKADGSIKDDDKKDNGIIGFIKEHKGTVIVATLAVITIGGLVTVIIVKKQRSRIV